MAEPLPVLIPHPQLHRAAHRLPLANGEVNHVGEPIVMVVADRPVRRRGRRRAGSVVDYEALPAVVGVDGRARGGARGARRTCPDNVAAHMRAGDRGRRAGDGRRAAHADLHCTSSGRASHAHGGQGRLRPLGRRRRRCGSTRRTQASTSVACRDRGEARSCRWTRSRWSRPDVGGGFGVKIVHPWPEEVLVPWAASARPRGQVDRGPPRALHLLGARARAASSRSRSGSTTTAGSRRSTCTFWHDNGAYTPYGIIVPIVTVDPAARAVQAGRLPGRVRLAVHQHRDRHPVPRRRPAAGLLRDGADDGRDRRRARAGPGRGPRAAT